MRMNKRLLIKITILVMILTRCVFNDCFSSPNIPSVSQNNSYSQDNSVSQNNSASQNNAVSQNNSDTNIKRHDQNTVETTTHNNTMSTPERQAIMQKHNIHRVGPVPNEPNVEPLGSCAL